MTKLFMIIGCFLLSHGVLFASVANDLMLYEIEDSAGNRGTLFGTTFDLKLTDLPGSSVVISKLKTSASFIPETQLHVIPQGKYVDKRPQKEGFLKLRAEYEQAQLTQDETAMKRFMQTIRWLRAEEKWWDKIDQEKFGELCQYCTEIQDPSYGTTTRPWVTILKYFMYRNFAQAKMDLELFRIAANEIPNIQAVYMSNPDQTDILHPTVLFKFTIDPVLLTKIDEFDFEELKKLLGSNPFHRLEYFNQNYMKGDAHGLCQGLDSESFPMCNPLFGGEAVKTKATYFTKNILSILENKVAPCFFSVHSVLLGGEAGILRLLQSQGVKIRQYRTDGSLVG
ncbi:hypothetical protein [Candidatus Nucleicultrix amoebiphila]|jgi:hypothetical protein|uniref:Uncharacterized protein n=1 Tax=Candidatus Nucleicultrix amoebiphila FS5 TaxID=1414854 RepID=A0A1W6N3Y5_9PROT|nr:hypothetical protein [Candidatus Nucleicultrix amoebiphila]ARN84489.1 hypothetical protein GQ61_03180 [Candidatus Nucleicultrix amoebiphila FS5]